MDADGKLQAKILATLDAALGHSRLSVRVDGNVATLGGFARSIAEKQAAEHCVRTVEGVAALVVQVMIDCTDAQGCEVEAIQALLQRWASEIGPENAIDVVMEEGVVTLTGLLDWPEQVQRAGEEAAKMLAPLKVENLIEVRNKVSDADIRKRIGAALARSTTAAHGPVTVVVEGDHVRLGGRVAHWHERQVAERAAFASPGVAEVENNILVG